MSQPRPTSTPEGSYSAKTGDNDCNVNSSRYSLSTALCESNSLLGQVWTKRPTRPTQGRHVAAAVTHPWTMPAPTRTHYGSSQTLALSQIITDRPVFFKQFKISFQDHPEPSWQRYKRVMDLGTVNHGSDPGQSVAVWELGVTVALSYCLAFHTVSCVRLNCWVLKAPNHKQNTCIPSIGV